MQFVSLFRGGEKAQMSTRSGEFVTLRELRTEVGNDAARLFYVMRSNDQHLDFDLELAKARSNDNPVYYIQYAHARVASVKRQMQERGLAHDAGPGSGALGLLAEPQETAADQALELVPGNRPALRGEARTARAGALSARPRQRLSHLSTARTSSSSRTRRFAPRASTSPSPRRS